MNYKADIRLQIEQRIHATRGRNATFAEQQKRKEKPHGMKCRCTSCFFGKINRNKQTALSEADQLKKERGFYKNVYRKNDHNASG